MPPTCGRRPLGLQLGVAAQAGELSSHQEESHRHRATSRAQWPQEDRSSLDVSGLQVRAAGSAVERRTAAFHQFFRRCALKKQGKWKGKLGYPQFKTKKKGLGSFRLTGRIVVSDKAIVLPRL